MYSVTPTSASSNGESRDDMEVSGPWGIQEGTVQLGRKSLWDRGSSMNRPQGERKGLKHWEDKAKALVRLQHTGRVRGETQYKRVSASVRTAVSQGNEPVGIPWPSRRLFSGL